MRLTLAALLTCTLLYPTAFTSAADSDEDICSFLGCSSETDDHTVDIEVSYREGDTRNDQDPDESYPPDAFAPDPCEVSVPGVNCAYMDPTAPDPGFPAVYATDL